MYSAGIKHKIEKIFDDLQLSCKRIISSSNSFEEATNEVTQYAAKFLTTRSEAILSNMLSSLSKRILETDEFTTPESQLVFRRANLYDEIKNKYSFSVEPTIEYKEAKRILQALKVGGGTLVIGGIGEIGVTLIKGLSLSSLVPIPIGILVAAALGAALVDFFAIEPYMNKRNFYRAVDNYLSEAQLQFLNWFDEVERYFNKRVGEIKSTM